MWKENELKGKGMVYNTPFRKLSTENPNWWKRDDYELAFPSYSPYQPMGSNPINFVDPTGLFKEDPNGDGGLAKGTEAGQTSKWEGKSVMWDGNEWNYNPGEVVATGKKPRISDNQDGEGSYLKKEATISSNYYTSNHEYYDIDFVNHDNSVLSSQDYQKQVNALMDSWGTADFSSNLQPFLNDNGEMGDAFAGALQTAGFNRFGSSDMIPSPDGNGSIATPFVDKSVASTGHIADVIGAYSMVRAGGALFRNGAALLKNTKNTIHSVDDIISNPKILEYRSLSEIKPIIENSKGWRPATMSRSRHGDGWVLEELTEAGNLTGRRIQWHPGTHRHFNGNPYWKISDGNGINKPFRYRAGIE
jgi:hypothetical protein